MNIKHCFLLCFLFFFMGCTQEKRQIDIPQSCDNVFVLSDYSDYVVMLEYNRSNLESKILYDDLFGNYAYYDCARKSLIALQDIDRGLVKTYDLKKNTIKSHEVGGGYNVMISRYKSGFIYSAARMERSEVDPSLGYTPPSKIVPKSRVLDPENKDIYSQKVIADYKQGKRWYMYVDNYFFDLDSQKIKAHYPFGMMVNGERIGDTLYVQVSGFDFLKIDLKTGKSQKMYEANTTSQKNIPAIPKNAPRLFANGDYYVAMTEESWNVRDQERKKLVGYQKNALYVMQKNKTLRLLSNLPIGDIVYMNSPDRKNIYLFTKSRKVIKYNIKQQKVLFVRTIKADINPSYVLTVVGYTKTDFIYEFNNLDGVDSYVVVGDQDITKIGTPKAVEITHSTITTEQTVSTNVHRTNFLE